MDKLLRVDVTVDSDDYEKDVYRILQVIKPQWEMKNIIIEVWFCFIPFNTLLAQ